MRNWLKFCAELGYDKDINFGDTERERTRMTRQLADWLQWNAERVGTRGKKKGQKAMSSADSFVSYLAAVTRATRESGRDWNPTAYLSSTIKRICRQYASGAKRKLPIFISMIDRMEKAEALDMERREDLQVLTIMLMSVFGLLRISEILCLRWSDVERSSAHPASSRKKRTRETVVTLTLRNSKTIKHNGGLPEHVVICGREGYIGTARQYWDPLHLLEKWYRTKQTEGKASGEDKLFEVARDVYARAMKRALETIGVKADSYDTHSGRIGGATMLWEGGATDEEIKELGRWKSDSWKIYCRKIKSKCLELSRLVSNSKLDPSSLVGSHLAVVVEGGE